jgi:hypothetical protein
MNRLNRALIALAVCTGFAAASPASAQQAPPQREPLKPILTGKFVPPIRGVAEIQFTRSKTTRKGKEAVTVMQVKNVSNAPIAALKCSELWYDKQRAPVPGGDTYVHKKLLQPGEVITVTLTDEIDARMDYQQFQFTHANGQIKAKAVPKF